jgi:hypothetical protein
MSDPNFFPFFPDAVPAVKHVSKHVAHHIHHAKPAVQAVAHVTHQGVSMLTLFISNVVTAAIAVGISWYVSHRGIQGVKNDVANATTEIRGIKARIFPEAAVVPVQAPVAPPAA